MGSRILLSNRKPRTTRMLNRPPGLARAGCNDPLLRVSVRSHVVRCICFLSSSRQRVRAVISQREVAAFFFLLSWQGLAKFSERMHLNQRCLKFQRHFLIRRCVSIKSIDMFDRLRARYLSPLPPYSLPLFPPRPLPLLLALPSSLLPVLLHTCKASDNIYTYCMFGGLPPCLLSPSAFLPHPITTSSREYGM